MRRKSVLWRLMICMNFGRKSDGNVHIATMINITTEMYVLIAIMKIAGRGMDFGGLKMANYTYYKDVVPMSVFEQVKWERDSAIEQLNSYGVGLG